MDREELIARREAIADVLLERGWVTYHKSGDFHWYERDDALEAADAILAALESRPAPTERQAVRSMDESGSPESVGCIAQAWIGQRGQEAAGIYGAEHIELVYETAKALILYVDRKPMSVATIWRDPMNFAQLVRWSATVGNPAVAALATETQPVAGGEQEGLFAALNRLGQPEGWDGTWEQAVACCQCAVLDYFAAKPTTPERANALEEAARVADELEAWADLDEQYGHKARAENSYAAVKALRAYTALSASPPEVVEQ